MAHKGAAPFQRRCSLATVRRLADFEMTDGEACRVPWHQHVLLGDLHLTGVTDGLPERPKAVGGGRRAV